MPDKSLSLQEITQPGVKVTSISKVTPMVQRCETLWITPLDKWTVSDLRLMLGQKYDPEILIPLAMEVLTINPILQASYYPGDLLEVSLECSDFWTDTTPELPIMLEILENLRLPDPEAEDIRRSLCLRP